MVTLSTEQITALATMLRDSINEYFKSKSETDDSPSVEENSK